MKKCVIFLYVLIPFVLLMVTGCSSEVENEEQKIIVQKRTDDENQYEDFKEITDNEQVRNVKRILDEANWKDAHVTFVRPADYQFVFQFKNPQIEAKAVLFSVWVSPKKDLLEMTRGEHEFTQLTKEESARLFEMIRE
ncbi:hypothetical protein DET59_1112 [Rossellomorea aquimaris]|uniref:YhfM-like domain-containing protein n=1 Tax=Rossellomorea aquimaris TaxID=189382 RepID=A0A366EN67_9BACI|nr:hypothetical protein DET59_1112 [Rossellomorea aquimaris]